MSGLQAFCYTAVSRMAGTHLTIKITLLVTPISRFASPPLADPYIIVPVLQKHLHFCQPIESQLHAATLDNTRT